MADVIHLEVGQDPPDTPCMVVARDITGGFYVVSSQAGYHRGAPASDVPISDAERAGAINRATAYADAHGIAKVYVVI